MALGPDHIGTARLSRRVVLSALGAGALSLASSNTARATPTTLSDRAPFAPSPAMPLIMATGAPGGGFSLYGPAFATLAEQSLHLPIAFRASGGSAANILLLEQNEAQLGMASLAIANQAWMGSARWTGGLKMRGFRALFPIYQQQFQIVSLVHGKIRQLDDLAGQRIGVGPRGGTGAVLAPGLLRVTGVQGAKLITGGYDQQIAALRTGALDACAFFGASPLPAIARAASGGQFRLIGLTAPSSRAAGSFDPGVSASIVPRTALPGLTRPVMTVGSPAMALARADLPDPIAAALTEAALLHQANLLATARIAVPAHDVWQAGIDTVAIHPGAVPVLRRHGIVVPDKLIGKPLGLPKLVKG